jgi:hypothetical protein
MTLIKSSVNTNRVVGLFFALISVGVFSLISTPAAVVASDVSITSGDGFSETVATGTSTSNFSSGTFSLFIDEETTTEEAFENTNELCHDGIDNNFNFLVDASDPSCSPFFPEVTPVENTSELCHDSIDNDGDFLVDASDPDCTPFFVQATSTPKTETTPPPDDRLNPNAATAVSGGGGFSLPTGPAVLGASTSDETSGPSCSLYLNSYMRIGMNNDVSDVKKLQEYLNKELGLSLPITGFFGTQTDAAVKQLQAKYSDEIMKPWVDAGLETSVAPTGYVYKTTLWFINTHSNNCAGKIPFPTLK